ncbi:MAG: phosphoadenosine phosphosulfate reductase family protein [Conexivisphaera sp.]|jgi:phosphoadenosine phosphosulfate reductase|nr:phosphoadenosine phosphosulfate reductase family protein [Conexivisphaerales archaeon]
MNLDGSLARRVAEAAEARGMDPAQYISFLMDKSTPQRRLDLLPMRYKAEIAMAVSRAALESLGKVAVVWSGGKDSTVVLHLFREASSEVARGYDVVFIDHFMHFEETLEFVDRVAAEWGLRIIFKGNERLRGYQYGDEVSVDELDQEDADELLRIGYTARTFRFALNNVAANHLLKTVPMRELVRNDGYEGLAVGIRWDENPARAGEVFFSRRPDPAHIRVHPILPFTERDVWDYTISRKLPVNPLYGRGYRSIDDKYETRPSGDRPAWEQDLDGTPERVGRAQDKEGIMELLRRYGYM